MVPVFAFLAMSNDSPLDSRPGKEKEQALKKIHDSKVPYSYQLQPTIWVFLKICLPAKIYLI